VKRSPENMAASARARLLERAKREGADYNRVLTRYCGERLLYRLSRSEYAERFVLKGASLFVIWRGSPHRASRDVDLLGFGAPDPGALRATLLEVFAVAV
jgi:predicted nucleotidyltransferase component of viral defense system